MLPGHWQLNLDENKTPGVWHSWDEHTALWGPSLPRKALKQVYKSYCVQWDLGTCLNLSAYLESFLNESLTIVPESNFYISFNLFIITSCHECVKKGLFVERWKTSQALHFYVSTLVGWPARCWAEAALLSSAFILFCSAVPLGLQCQHSKLPCQQLAPPTCTSPAGSHPRQSAGCNRGGESPCCI